MNQECRLGSVTTVEAVGFRAAHSVIQYVLASTPSSG